jgi:hypothetical protein
MKKISDLFTDEENEQTELLGFHASPGADRGRGGDTEDHLMRWTAQSGQN